MLENQFYLISSIASKYPSIKWNKNNFEVNSNLNDCETIAVNFAKELEDKYDKILQDLILIPSFSNPYLKDTRLKSLDYDELLELEKKEKAEAQNRYEKLINNPDKSTLDWKIVEKVNLVSITKKLILFIIYSFIFAIFFTTAKDLILLIRSNKD